MSATADTCNTIRGVCDRQTDRQTDGQVLCGACTGFLSFLGAEWLPGVASDRLGLEG